MKNAYTEEIRKICKSKDWGRLNSYIYNRIDEIPKGQVVITKRIASKLTLPTIVYIACKHKEVLDYIPDYGVNDPRALVIDWMKDGKLDREYKKPNIKTVLNIFDWMRGNNCPGHAVLLFNEVGVTKDEFLKGYRYGNKYNWTRMFDYLSGFKMRPKDQDIRKLYSKYQDHGLLYLTSKHLDSELIALFDPHSELDIEFAQRRYFEKHLNKFSDRAVLYAFLRFYKQFSDRCGPSAGLAEKIARRLIKAEQKGLYEIISNLYNQPLWGESLIKYNKELSFLKDGQLDVILSMLPEDKKFDYVCNYLKIKTDDLHDWRIK